MTLALGNLAAPDSSAEDNRIWLDDHPIRSEIFGEDRLREHAVSLAKSHHAAGRGASHVSVLRRIRGNHGILKQATQTLLETVSAGGVITPAAEWLVDNSYTAEQHIQQVIEDLPSGYYRQLPKLADGHLKSHPRVMAIAWAYVAHTDSRFDEDTLAEFVNAYQSVTPLSIGEIWALAIHLRILLIENAKRVAVRTVISRDARNEADALAESLTPHAAPLNDIERVMGGLADHAKLSFIVHLMKRARGQRDMDAATVTRLHDMIVVIGQDAEGAAHEEHARQTANNVTMQNIFTSLKRIGEQDWESWFERVNLADKRLAQTPIYPGLDSASRTVYRSAVEDLARHSSFSEEAVAILAVREAEGGDPGQVLLGGKRQALERRIAYRPPLARRLRMWVRQLGAPGYILAIAALSLVIVLIGLSGALSSPVSLGLAAMLSLVLIAPAFDAAMAMVNFAVTQLMRPMVLPGLSFDAGIPPAHRTMIAVPIMITSPEGIVEMLQRLEGHYLSNDDSELFYALISDWKDSAVERSAGDDALLASAVAGIAHLNYRHGHQRFMLFHRPRTWNPSQKTWMGWERKRGKLHDLNRLLRGGPGTAFVSMPERLPEDVKYVIVLDADTLLPRGAARRLVGKMAHPLNRPSFDAQSGRVTSGYGILQPRVTIALPERGRGSLFQRIFAGRSGIDPYVFAASDVYQDLFGEGSFTGKGIYDIDAFEAAVAGRIPENTLLSHDLFEGNFARAGLVSDVQVVEDFPERYLADMARHHRWARGDWQLLPWMFPRAKGLTGLGFWKMSDNLRRTLTPSLTLAALIAGWAVLPALPALAWTLFLLFLIFVPSFLPIFAGSSLRREPITVESQLLTILDDIVSALRLTGARLAFLGHQSWTMLDAVARTLYRLSFSRRNLLEWTAAAQMQSSLKPSLAGSYWLMASSPAIGIAVLLGALVPDARLSGVALPFGLAWCLAPALAYFISAPPRAAPETEPDREAAIALRAIALRTWRYFDTHVGPEDNMLPPDNFQEDPLPQTGHRTSPTNIGLYLLSAVSARDLGWIGTDEAAARIAAALTTLDRLETYRGHLFNWYDTRTLAPLEPRYVSTVDSGNLAGHLIAVANACGTWQSPGAFDTARLDGLADIVHVIKSLSAETSRTQRVAPEAVLRSGTLLDALAGATGALKKTADLLGDGLANLDVQVSAAEHSLHSLWDGHSFESAEDGLYWLGKLRGAFEAMRREATSDAERQATLTDMLARLATKCRRMAYGMDFKFLMNPQRHLLSIGYRMGDESLDQSCYDLLASEASLTSFFAIAKADVEEKHWVRLGRPVVAVGRAACLVSWSGSMFEYLMPLLLMRSPDGTLYSQTMRLVVQKQIAHAMKRGTPWGISESAYAARDRNFVYQYSSFGVPGLGLKRGLGDSHVIAPYATGLAAMIAPREAVENYRKLEALGGAGRYGFYEAIDFTASRLRAGQPHEIIRAHFAHHQGMTITAIHNAVSGGALRSYFHRENTVRATELLLQERAPDHLPVKTAAIDRPRPAEGPHPDSAEAARFIDPDGEDEAVAHLLSNGPYAVMITATGTGYSRWNGIAINRWREDATAGGNGMAIMLRDLTSGAAWPAASEPRLGPHASAQAIFSQEKAEFHRIDDAIVTHLECIVSTEDDAEARCLHLVNTSDEARSVEYTSYMELALAHPVADAAHPAFAKLFVETEFLPDLQALVATRRRRQESDPHIWVAQFIVCDNETATAVEYETSREAFLGRGNPLAEADALASRVSLGGSTGSVLDPVFALRQRVSLLPHRKTRAVIWTIAAATREALLEKVSRHRTISVYERVEVLSWTQSRILLRHLSIDTTEANLFQQLASALVFSSRRHRPTPKAIADGMRPQSALWPLSISGNRPILAVRIKDVEDAPLLEQVLRLQDYLYEKRLAIDIVIINERPTSYLQDLQGLLDTLIAKQRISQSLHAGGEQGEIFLLRNDLLQPGVLDALLAAARIVLDAAHGKLEQQLTRTKPKTAAYAKTPPLLLPPVQAEETAPSSDGLQFFNGIGGFDTAGREYVILHDRHRPLPAPWINVIANPKFGTHCSAEGGGYTWFQNSRERQITAWSNDAAADPPSEVFYIHDIDTGILASPAVQPLGRRAGQFRTRHGFGYTVHDGREQGLAMVLTQTVATGDAVKRVRLRVTNLLSTSRRLRVTFYAEAVMGQRRAAAAHFISSEHDTASGALFLRNRWNPDFAGTVVFADFQGLQTSWTGNRRAVFGKDGDLRSPRGLLAQPSLGNETGGGYDPCAALQMNLQIAPHQSAEVILTFGAGETADDARALVTRYRSADFSETLDASVDLWRDLVDAVQVKTPDAAFDIMMNGWLMYQTISCRMWARSGFYQASGAFGFRDQLQDSLTLAHVRPDLARQHILTAASRQFLEGDVQHWWLPETGAGVRTRISDDTVWLAYCTAYYVELTGDAGILDESLAFLEGPPLQDGEHDAFFIPAMSAQTATLYAHCVLALSRNLAAGAHGLPLMGTGDWNDGMNRVGEGGKGESVWLGWFLCVALEAFESLAAARQDTRSAERWSICRTELAAALDSNGWDGAWYRRAYFDDGTPLGMASAAECRIDAIAQSWAVLSGVADPLKARRAMESAEQHLIDWDARVAQLFWPPFEHHVPSPGYIQDYPPGIRENGGQYSHGAIWATFAFAKLGETEKAARLFALINPINHALTLAGAWTYRVEPYAVVADIYSVAPHRGRGGWTWYTGAAGWSYRAGLEAVLGLRRRGGILSIQPCIPEAWPGFDVTYKYKGKSISLSVKRTAGNRAAAAVLMPDSGCATIDLDSAPDGGHYHVILTPKTP